MPQRIKRLVVQVAPLVVLGLFYCYLATKIPLDSQGHAGPDEIQRLLVPKAMLKGKLLPSGLDPDTILPWGNWSYAYYPQMIGAYVTTIFMAGARLIGAGSIGQLFAARMSSVLWGLLGAFFVGKTVRTLLTDRADSVWYGLLATLMIGAWPQYAFLSSYVNNDIVGLAGVSILICASVMGIKRGWDMRSIAALVVGIVVCALGYLSSYGFILAGIVTFIVTCLAQHRDNRPVALKMIGFAALACAICTFPFFIVNIVRYGDPIGSKAFATAYDQWLADGGAVLRWPIYTGPISLIFENDDFIRRTTQSFVGMFGYFHSTLPEIIGMSLIGTLTLGCGAFLGHKSLVSCAISKRWRVFVAMMIVGTVTTFFLHIWYSDQVDYEPQGRYIIDILVPWCVMAIIGLRCIFRKSRIALCVFALLFVAVALGGTVYTVIHTGWPGIAASNPEFLQLVIP